MGKTTVERLVYVGPETQFHLSFRGTAIAVGIAGAEGVEGFAIGCRHVLYVSHVLQPSLNLERRGSCFGQFLQHVKMA